MNKYHTVCQTSEIADPGKQTFEIDDSIVVVFHLHGSFYCIDDVCTHDGGPLGDGELTGNCIACPRHGAKFDIQNGQAMTMPATEDTKSHDVKIDGDHLLVRLNDE